MKRILQLFFIVLACSSCEPEREKWTIPTEVREFCDFQEGSWWVYRLEGSTVRDTHRVQSRTFKSEYLEGYQSAEFEYINLNLSISHNPDSSLLPPRLYIEALKTQEASCEDIQFPNYINTYTFWSFDIVGDSVGTYQNDGIMLWDKLDSLEVNGKTYFDILVFKTTVGLNPMKPLLIYWARHIGKVRIRTFNNSIWNLESFDVSQ